MSKTQAAKEWLASHGAKASSDMAISLETHNILTTPYHYS